MSCSCGSSEFYGDPEPAEAYTEGRIKKTRKSHPCADCDATIPEGSRCCFVKWVGDGTAATQYRCLDCAALAEILSNDYDLCACFGELYDACSEAGIDVWEWKDRLAARDRKDPTP